MGCSIPEWRQLVFHGDGELRAWRVWPAGEWETEERREKVDEGKVKGEESEVG